METDKCFLENWNFLRRSAAQASRSPIPAGMVRGPARDFDVKWTQTVKVEETSQNSLRSAGLDPENAPDNF